MDTELARTFLAIVAAGNFSAAAERLHLTQSTISARIRTLETQLGCTLFVRNKGGALLTPAGRQFQKHAGILVRTVEQARHDVGVPRGFRAALTIGGRFGLWESFLLKALPLLRARAPDLSVRAEIGFDADLMQGLVEGRLDLAVMYTPQSRPGLTVEFLFDERLVLASSTPLQPSELGADYVHVDWGPEFYARHSSSFSELAGPALTANIGWLALHHILDCGGSGYFPLRLVRPYFDSGQLIPSKKAPEFSLPAYMVYAAEHDPGLLGAALAGVRQLAAGEMAG